MTTTPGPSQEAIEAVATSIRSQAVRSSIPWEEIGDDIRNMYRGHAQAAILAYHAHLASKGLKVAEIDYKYVCVNGHDLCYGGTSSGPECPYCERRAYSYGAQEVFG